MADGVGAGPVVERVLVTGGCGYVGSRLVPDLLVDETVGSVRVIDSLSTGRLQALMDLPENRSLQFIEADLLDPASIDLALEGVDAVVHLAGIGATPVTFSDRESMQRVNRWATAHLLDHCRERGVRRFIFASTASVYGSGACYAEDAPLRPLGTFAQSKRDAEGNVRVRGEHALDATILRLGTVYGWAPGVRFDAAPNRFAYWAGVGRALSVFGTGEQRRPLLHVQDASGAIRFCLARPGLTAGRVFNVASGNYSLLELVEAVRSFRPEVRVRFTDQEILTHLTYEVDISALTEAGWSAGTDLAPGLAELSSRFEGLVSRPPATVEP